VNQFNWNDETCNIYLTIYFISHVFYTIFLLDIQGLAIN